LSMRGACATSASVTPATGGRSRCSPSRLERGRTTTAGEPPTTTITPPCATSRTRPSAQQSPAQAAGPAGRGGRRAAPRGRLRGMAGVAPPAGRHEAAQSGLELTPGHTRLADDGLKRTDAKFIVIWNRYGDRRVGNRLLHHDVAPSPTRSLPNGDLDSGHVHFLMQTCLKLVL
jgi:hypothetical protein